MASGTGQRRGISGLRLSFYLGWGGRVLER